MPSQTESQLSFMLRKLSTEQKAKLIFQLGVTERTWNRWLNRPAELIPAGGLMIVKLFLDTLDPKDPKDHNMAELLKPVEITA